MCRLSLLKMDVQQEDEEEPYDPVRARSTKERVPEQPNTIEQCPPTSSTSGLTPTTPVATAALPGVQHNINVLTTPLRILDLLQLWVGTYCHACGRGGLNNATAREQTVQGTGGLERSIVSAIAASNRHTSPAYALPGQEQQSHDYRRSANGWDSAPRRGWETPLPPFDREARRPWRYRNEYHRRSSDPPPPPPFSTHAEASRSPLQNRGSVPLLSLPPPLPPWTSSYTSTSSTLAASSTVSTPPSPSPSLGLSFVAGSSQEAPAKSCYSSSSSSLALPPSQTSSVSVLMTDLPELPADLAAFLSSSSSQSSAVSTKTQTKKNSVLCTSSCPSSPVLSSVPQKRKKSSMTTLSPSWSPSSSDHEKGHDKESPGAGKKRRQKPDAGQRLLSPLPSVKKHAVATKYAPVVESKQATLEQRPRPGTNQGVRTAHNNGTGTAPTKQKHDTNNDDVETFSAALRALKAKNVSLNNKTVDASYEKKPPKSTLSTESTKLELCRKTVQEATFRKKKAMTN